MHNFMMVAGRDGRLHAVVVFDYTRLFRLQSTDDGATWSDPVEITPLLRQFDYDVKAFGTGCGHGIQLKSGRLIVPVWFSDNSHSAHRPSDVATIWSDDGESWRPGETVCRTSDTYRWPSEAAVAELSDGRVIINMRNESDPRRRLISISPDGVSGWSPARFAEELVEPVCQGSMIWSPSIGALVLVNPDTLDQTMTPAGGRKSDRKNLTLQVSRDQGAIWAEKRVIEPGPAGYSDLCDLGHGRLVVVFEAGALGDMHASAAVVVETVKLSS
jgi:sialidase-1